MRHSYFLAIVTLIFLLGCQGSVPANQSDPGAGGSAVLLRGRFLLPSGEINDGSVAINLESDQASYQLTTLPKQTQFYAVKPGSYRIAPVRNILGNAQDELVIDFNHESYRVPFPHEWLDHAPIIVQPGSIASIGILEARLSPAGSSGESQMTIRWFDDVQSRRELVQDMIRVAVDPKVSPDTSHNATNWSMALDRALIELQQSNDSAPSQKTPAP